MLFYKNKLLLSFFLYFFSFTLFASHSDRTGPIENIGGFIEGTIVQTSDGPDTIQNIRVGDILFSFSQITGEIVKQKVTHVHVFNVEQTVKLMIGGEEFFLNPDHRFYIPSSSEWIAARDLVPGIQLLTRSGELLALTSKEVIDRIERLYDLSIEETENYYVGKNGILVHNFAFVIPIVTWVIGEGLLWVTAATVAATIVTTVVANEISKVSSNRQTGTIEASNGNSRSLPDCDRQTDCDARYGRAKSPNQMNQQIKSGNSPRTIERVDVGKIKGEQDHVHFKDRSALNRDGTWKHGGRKLTNSEKEWLRDNGWRTPND